MAYFIPAGATLEIQIVGSLDNQVTRTVFHYWYPTGGPAIPDGAASALGIMTDFADKVYGPMAARQSDSWSLLYLQAQWILPLRYRAVQKTAGELAIAAGGTIGGACAPVNVAMCFSTFCQRSGKTFAGRHWIPGVPMSTISQSVLTTPALGFLQAVADTSLLELDDGATGFVEPVILTKKVQPVTDKIVTVAIARDTVRTARRRTVGRGE